MIPREKNPDYINSFLDYSITILNKSPNSVKEYNYDLASFFKFWTASPLSSGYCLFHAVNESFHIIAQLRTLSFLPSFATRFKSSFTCPHCLFVFLVSFSPQIGHVI